MELLSNERQVTSRTPPTFLWHTADDDAVPVANSLLFFEALTRAGVPGELHVFPHGRHGLGLAPGDPSVSQWPPLCAVWMEGLGLLSSRGAPVVSSAEEAGGQILIEASVSPMEHEQIQDLTP